MSDLPRLRVDERLPAACDAHDLARAFGVSVKTILRWKKNGKLRRFELPKSIGTKHWSGARVHEFLNGGGHVVALQRAS